MSAVISTHVLDIARGIPAAGVAVVLYAIDGDRRTLLAQAVTDEDGRAGAIATIERAGTYELVFAAGAYLRDRGDVPFFDDVPIRFAVDSAEGRYHVPLLLAAAGYTTYRGS